MATLITKNSSTASSVPTNAQLVQGELAVNVTDKRLYTENASGTVVELGTNPGSAVTHTAGTAGAPAITTTGDTNTGIFFPAADTVAASTGGTERLRLDTSGNLGIGTSSPSTKLQVNFSSATAYSSGATGNGLIIYNTSTTTNQYAGIVFQGEPTAGNAGQATIYGTTTGSGAMDLVFSTRGSSTLAERMRLDSSGNLGLGVTPSAWRSGHSVIQLGGGTGLSLASGTGSGYGLFQNAYLDAVGPKYTNNGFASSYYQFNGAHQWYTAPSGTAGNAISFTQAMKLTAGGDLGVGTTSPESILHVAKASSGGLGAQVILDNTATSALNNAVEISFLTDVGASGSGTRNARIRAVNENAANGNANLQFWTWNGATDAERARITSGGDLLVGTTANSPGYGNTNTGTQLSATQSNFSANSVDWVMTVNQNGSDGGSRYFVSFRVSNSSVGNITSNGTTTFYNTTSDYRLKENIQPMTGALAKVAALKPCTYKWKADGSDGEGFIAHELAEVVPQCVTGEKDAVDEDGKPVYQGIDTSFLVATLAAAIKELKAEFDAYKATHP